MPDDDRPQRLPEGRPTDDELARWRALADAATPGPWMPSGSTDPVCIGGLYWREGEVVERILTDRTDADAAFIAGAREAMPRLLAEVARLRIALRAARDLARIAETTRSRAAEWARQEERERMQREVDAQRATNAALTAEVERLRSQLARESRDELADRVLEHLSRHGD